MIDFLYSLHEGLLFASSLFIVACSIFISIKLRFVQLTIFPVLKKVVASIFSNKGKEGQNTIFPYKALFTAMSTTLGIGTIVAPVIAITLGGPGALLGFVLVSFFGGAVTYAEVNLSIKYRQRRDNGDIMAGPMSYLNRILSPQFAVWYALSCSVLMIGWSGAQANQLAAFLDSPLLGVFRVPTFISGLAIAGCVIAVLLGGIKRIGSVSSKMVPVMFVLYMGSSLWLLGSNLHLLPEVISDIFRSAFTPYAMASGTLVGGIASSLRWGILKGSQVCEAGVGTQTIPHSLAETQDPASQGMLAVVSTFTAGLIAVISGCVALMTKTWLDPDLPLGMSMVASSYCQYFSTFGVSIIGLCTLLFALGTILGNSFNGSQTFYYLFDKKYLVYYYCCTGFFIFLSSMMEVKTMWSIVDPLMIGMVIPHLCALTYFVHQNAHELLVHQNSLHEV